MLNLAGSILQGWKMFIIFCCFFRMKVTMLNYHFFLLSFHIFFNFSDLEGVTNQHFILTNFDMLKFSIKQ